jgi:hypothetical protein
MRLFHNLLKNRPLGGVVGQESFPAVTSVITGIMILERRVGIPALRLPWSTEFNS